MLIMDLVLWEYRNILFFYYLYIIAFFRKEYINGISFIPGINIEKSEPKAFIQVITNNTSYFHAILSMQNNANGSININNYEMKFDNDMGYIEKDWGCSFPKTYIWCQGNNFQKSNASFMISIADVPFKMFKFKGVICVLLLDDKEYKFTTYNNAKLAEYDINDNSLNITLKKGEYYLNVKSTFDRGQKLAAPVKGGMSKDIFENISSLITVTLRQGDKTIFF